jgi:hypothetical protein
MLRNVYAGPGSHEDQMKMLQAVRASLNISEEMHKELEEQIKQELNVSKAPKGPIPERDLNLLIQDDQPEPSESMKPEMPSEEPKEEPKPAPLPIPPPSTHSQHLIKLKLKKFITLGKEKYRHNDFEGALEFFTQGKEIAPDNDEIDFLLKKSRLKIKKTKSESEKSLIQQAKEQGMNLEDSTSRLAIPIGNAVTTSLNGGTLQGSVNDQTDVASSGTAPAAIPVQPGEIDPTMESEVEAKPDNGSGTEISVDDDPSQCISCESTGKCYWCGGSGKCDRCNGSGTYLDSKCALCNGSGNCNSCSGDGSCMWCHGSGKNTKEKNSRYTPAA